MRERGNSNEREHKKRCAVCQEQRPLARPPPLRPRGPNIKSGSNRDNMDRNCSKDSNHQLVQSIQSLTYLPVTLQRALSAFASLRSAWQSCPPLPFWWCGNHTHTHTHTHTSSALPHTSHSLPHTPHFFFLFLSLLCSFSLLPLALTLLSLAQSVDVYFTRAPLYYCYYSFFWSKTPRAKQGPAFCFHPHISPPPSPQSAASCRLW
jgi:hypothetical protein